MSKPYFEFIRIGLDDRTGNEIEFNMLMRWEHVDRIEEEVGQPFDNRSPKTIIITVGGDTLWVLAPYAYVRNQYQAYLDGYLLHKPACN
jgi:hypothetical protein